MTSSELRSNIYWGAQNSPFSYNSFNWSVSGWDYDTTGSEGFPSISFFGLSGCGDGFLEDGEECDDGGTANGDGCSSSCAVEDGWWCEGEPSECGYCGDDSCGGGEDCLSCPTDCALTATVVKPEESAEYAPGTVPYRVASNICASEHPDETPYMWLWAEWWDGDSWEDGGSRLYEWDGFLTAGSYGNCGEGLTYGWGSLPVDPMAEWIQADGDWRMTAQVVSGEIEGEWSPAVEFSVSTGMGNPGDPGWFGDSTTVSWGEFPGSDGDDEGTWQAFVDAAEEGKPTCSFNLFSGDDGDGLSCVWSWIRYGIIPPEDAPRNIIASVWVKVRTRWPLAYIPQVASSIYGGMTASGGICPLPDIEGVEVAGMTVPGIDLCAISEEAAGWMDTDDWLSNWIAIAIWAMTGYLWYRAARHFCGA
ncbi:hypothetical protein JW899_05185 [Candidatus Uhrbacteria bacterium]|nr:hypothetical protein [Candidatus Uhrbacteria bacterium]